MKKKAMTEGVASGNQVFNMTEGWSYPSLFLLRPGGRATVKKNKPDGSTIPMSNNSVITNKKKLTKPDKKDKYPEPESVDRRVSAMELPDVEANNKLFLRKKAAETPQVGATPDEVRDIANNQYLRQREAERASPVTAYEGATGKKAPGLLKFLHHPTMQTIAPYLPLLLGSKLGPMASIAHPLITSIYHNSLGMGKLKDQYVKRSLLNKTITPEGDKSTADYTDQANHKLDPGNWMTQAKRIVQQMFFQEPKPLGVTPDTPPATTGASK